MLAKIKWEIEFNYPIPDTHWEHAKAHLEENLCQENLLNYLVSQSKGGQCKLCPFGKVTLLELKNDICTLD